MSYAIIELNGSTTDSRIGTYMDTTIAVSNNEEYNPPVTTKEKFVKASILQTVLENYDEKKGTAVVEATSLPSTVENRTYINTDETTPLNTKVWVKNTEMETKADAEYNLNHYIKYVSALPSPIDTDVVYGIDHTYSQDVSAKYLVQDFISTYMKKYGSNSWILNDFVTSSTATITYDGTDYQFNELYWTGKRYVTYLLDKSTGAATRVGSFGIQIGDLWNYALTWNYQHKDYYISESSTGKTVQLANQEQVEEWFLKKEELGKANGVAVLDGDGKIPKNELNFTALNYLGMTHTWPTDEDPEAGDFYIVDEEFTHTEGEKTTTLEPGDWIIYFTSWEIESNNVIVSSVNGKIGTVVLTGDDINVTYESVTDTINNTLPKLGKVNTVNGVEPDTNKNVEIDGDDINVTYEETTDTLNNTLPKLGKLKTVNSIEPDTNGNVDTIDDTVGTSTSLTYSQNGIKTVLAGLINTSTNKNNQYTGNIDNITSETTYYINNSNVSGTLPYSSSSGGWFLTTLINDVSNNYATQLAYNQDTTGSNMLIRKKASGTWSSWTAIGGGSVNTVNSVSPDSNGNVNVSNFQPSSGYWYNTGSGARYFHYEVVDTSTYKVPYTNVEVFVLRYSSYRGTAIAIRWDSSGSSQMWTNSLHDDAGTSSWKGWSEVVKGSWDGSTLSLTL